MLCRATQDGKGMVESSDKRGPLEKGMANHFSILALRTPWTAWKGKKIYNVKYINKILMIVKTDIIHSFVLSFHKYLLSTFYISVTILVIGVKKANTPEISTPHRAYILLGKISNKQNE